MESSAYAHQSLRSRRARRPMCHQTGGSRGSSPQTCPKRNSAGSRGSACRTRSTPGRPTGWTVAGWRPVPSQPSSCPGTGGRNCLRHVHTHSVDQSISGMRNVAGHLENMVNTNVTYSVSQSDRAKHDNAVPQHSRTRRWGTGCWYWWWVQRRRRGSARGVCTGAAAGGMCKPGWRIWTTKNSVRQTEDR